MFFLSVKKNQKHYFESPTKFFTQTASLFLQHFIQFFIILSYSFLQCLFFYQNFNILIHFNKLKLVLDFNKEEVWWWKKFVFLARRKLWITKTVNFPVRNSLKSGSWVGWRTARPSRRRVASCWSYKDSARVTSNFRAVRNLTAVLQDTGPVLLYARFTLSKNSFVAWKKQYSFNYFNF